MSRAIQTIAGFFTGAGAGTGAVTPAQGDTFAVPSFSTSANAYLGNVSWAGASVDFVRIRSPRLNDPNQGLRLITGTTQRRNLLPFGVDQRLYPGDTPTVEIDLTAASTGGLLATYEYDDLPGSQPRLASWDEVQPRINEVMGCEVDTVSGGIGQWGNGVAINNPFDNFEAGDDYALLGYLVSAGCIGIAINGQDTSGMKIGGPGDPDTRATRDYFIIASKETGRPWIPVIAANNKAGTLLQSVDVAAATAVKVTLILAHLA